MPLPDHRTVYAAFIVTACAYPLVRGGWPERAGIATCILGSVLSVIAQLPAATPYREVMRGVLSVDLMVGFAFLAIGVRSGRFWPIWSLAFTLAGVFAHVAREAMPHVAAARYFHTTGLWAYPTILAITLGTFLEVEGRT